MALYYNANKNRNKRIKILLDIKKLGGKINGYYDKTCI